MNTQKASRPVVLTVANGKGGVGKTSVSANVAGAAAARGITTLLVDLDPQGNSALDLGVWEHDQGRALGAAVSYGVPLTLNEARPGLLYSPAGKEGTGALHAVLAQRESQLSATGLQVLRDVLWGQPVDLVVIDTPPSESNRPVVDAALMASDWLLIPTKHDAASLSGIEGIAARLRDVTARHLSQAKALGVVLFGLAASSKAMRTDVLGELREGLAGSGIPLLDEVVIRSSERLQYDVRDRGLLVHEYAQAAADGQATRLRALRDGGKAQRFASNAEAVAGDYALLVDTVLAAMGFQRVAA